MSDSYLIRAALPVWREHFRGAPDPLTIGVERSIVWTTAASEVGPICGYALIPAEGHPWSAGFPNGVDVLADAERSRKNLRLFNEIAKRRGDPVAAMSELIQTADVDDDDRQWGLDDFLDVHGGVTWYHHPWVGFDTAHAGDCWPPEYDRIGVSRASRNLPRSINWTPELVIEEAKKLARQVAQIAELENVIDVDVVYELPNTRAIESADE